MIKRNVNWSLCGRINQDSKPSGQLKLMNTLPCTTIRRDVQRSVISVPSRETPQGGSSINGPKRVSNADAK
jgi:hypothetical protein